MEKCIENLNHDENEENGKWIIKTRLSKVNEFLTGLINCLAVDQGATNSNSQQLTSSLGEDLQYNSRNVTILRLKGTPPWDKQVKNWSILSLITMKNVQSSSLMTRLSKLKG